MNDDKAAMIEASQSEAPAAREKPGVPAPGPANDPTLALTQTRGTIITGLVVIALAFGGVGSWAALAPLKSAAVASGRVVVESQRKTVQHLEGGIVQALHVREGDRVEAGDILVTLEDSNLRATHQIALDRLRSLAAESQRLKAEREGAADLVFDHPLLEDRNDETIRELIDTQSRQFASRHDTLQTQINIREEQIDQMESILQGSRHQLESVEQQSALLSEELESLKKMVDKQFVARPQMLRMQREYYDHMGMIGELKSRIARVKKSMQETTMEITGLQADRMQQVDARFAQLRSEYLSVEEQVRAAEDDLRRSQIRAPASGHIHAMRMKTVGGVVRAGDAILDIVPDHDRLIVVAHVKPSDIDVVRPGLTAQIRFTSFNQRTTPTAVGQVSKVSADLFEGAEGQQPFYKATIIVSQAELDRLGSIQLYPGMPADVMIATGERTALQAVLVPLGNWSSRAFREQEG